MKNIKQKLEDKREVYEKKIKEMEQAKNTFNSAKAEAINLEGQISALEEILEDQEENENE